MEIICSYLTCSGPDNNSLTCYMHSIENKSVGLTSKYAYLPRGKTERDVKSLYIRYTILYPDFKLETFPVRIGELYPRLKAIYIGSCGLKALKREDLDGLEELETLFVRENYLTSLPSDLFIGKKNIKRISFRRNNLEVLSSQLLKPIPGDNLILADFRDNTKINDYYKPGDADAISLEQLMDKIDAQCDQPKEDRIPFTNVDHKNEMALGMIGCWKSGLFTDFAIVTKDQKVFKVHKAVIAIQSDVFAKMLEVDMSESKSGQMTIPDFDSVVVDQFVGYLYTGEIPDETHAMELFSLATIYDVPKLRSLCERIILNNITEANAREIFSLGHLYSSAEIKQKVFETVKKMLSEKMLPENVTDDPEYFEQLLLEQKELQKTFF